MRRVFFFLVAGGTGFALYLVISYTLHYFFHVGEVISVVAGTLLPILPTFWMQRELTFRSNESHSRSFPRYFALQVCNAGFIAMLTALGKFVGLPAVIVFPLCGLIGAVISYYVQARLIFFAN
ncbi:hypothetical protein GCM10010872_07190 [Dyella flava]|nr:hypothetical protein GCM10010872_07190 [Dyella flava]